MGLIAAEIDIQVPHISAELMEDFFKISKFAHEKSKASDEEKIYFERNQKKYPWDRRVLEFNGNILHNYRKHPAFNDIVPIIEQLPILLEDRVVLLIGQPVQSDYDFNWHFDNDHGYGFRICFGLTLNKTFLEFSKLKPEFSYCAPAIGKNGLEKIETHMVEEKIYSITPQKSNTILCINGSQYPHRVPPDNSVNARFVLIVRGKPITLEHLNFIQQIIE